MPTATTIFRPNSLSTPIAYDAPQGYRRATAGGCLRNVAGETVELTSNATTPPWRGDARVMVVGAARQIATTVDKRWRAMLRFVLRSQTIDVSSIVSGPVPTADMWPNVTAARLVWFNGDQGGVQGGGGWTLLTSDLLVRVGRGLYTPIGANEQPFGTSSECGTTYAAAASFGQAEATLAWADWAQPDRSWKTLTLSQGAIDALLKTITGASDDYLDFSFVLQSEGVDGVNVLRELAAWEPNPPRLEIDFTVADSTGSGSRVFATGLPSRAQCDALPSRAAVTGLPARAHAEALSSRAHVTSLPNRAFTEGR